VKRIAALDGWKGIAILLVLIDHLGRYHATPYRLLIGQHGVTICFTLSGFLITRLML
jgi:peptidoglycan/LPS O-acetylase OafA/YrhL